MSDQRFILLGCQSGRNHARLGLAVSIKNTGNAVVRNRVKRAARERFRILRDELGGIDIVVMAKPAVKTTERAQMRASLDSLFRSLSRKCAPS